MNLFQEHSYLINILFCTSFIVTVFITFTFRSFAKKLGLVAPPNNRSSHKHPIPSGGGIIITLSYVLCLFCILLFDEYINHEILLSIIIGAIFATIFGFVDDLVDIRTESKLVFQIFLGGWILYLFAKGLQVKLGILDGYSFWLFVVVCLFFLVWFLNAFNFMDGIDGMLASGSLLIALSSGLIILTLKGANENTFLLFLLIPICFGFLLFNFPPASIFMGDSGSLFLGYLIACLVLKTIVDNDMDFWTWLILLGHFLTETTLTSVMRIKLTKKWFAPHRSHAYQNLARLFNSHKKVTLYSIFFHLIWLLPIAFISAFKPEFGFLLYLLAIFPVIILTIKYGPLFSSE